MTEPADIQLEDESEPEDEVQDGLLRPTEPSASGPGSDEMNLAEFPFATLARRGDDRGVLEHETWITTRDGMRLHQKWVAGGGPLGLPGEFDERVYVALMKCARDQQFKSRRVNFSIYELLKIMGVSIDQQSYERVEEALKRLVSVTIFAEGAFWDNDKKKWTSAKSGFHIIERYWLRSREEDETVRKAEGVPAYIVWGEEIWRSFQSGYIKSLDLGMFYSLETALARRLFRFLDKRMRYQDTYEIDVFELAGRLGMARYEKPAHVKRKLQPAFQELIACGWLRSVESVKRGRYTRFRFVRGTAPSGATEEPLQLALPVFEEELWNRALHNLEGTMTKATFNAWFPQTQLLSLADGVATIGVPSEAAREWLASRLQRNIREALADCGEHVTDLHFTVMQTIG